MPSSPQPKADPSSSSLRSAPRLMLLGVAGIVLATFGLPIPVLTSLALIGIGADRDLRRRATGVARPPLVDLMRSIHALMYVALFATAWVAMLGVRPSLADRMFVAGDLVASLVLIVVLRPVGSPAHAGE